MSIVRKAASSEVGPNLEFVLSDETVDRYGDTVSAKGWQLADFKRNPIALFGHSSDFPIGRWKDVRVEGKRLVGRLEFASEGSSARIDELRRLVEQGILRAVSVGFRPMEDEPIDAKDPYGGRRYLKQELLECSLVSVPANPAALARAADLKISDDVITLAFGEQAERGGAVRRGSNGEHAAPSPVIRKGQKMTKTISERVEDAQQAFVAARDAYNDLVAEEDFDLEAAEGLKASMEEADRRLKALQDAEKALAGRTEAERPKAPAVNAKGRQKDLSGMDLMVRAFLVRGMARHENKPIDQVLEERYPGHEATAVVTKADQTIGTTTGSHWADDIVRNTYGDFMHELSGVSIYPKLRDRGVGVSFSGNGSVTIPGRTAGGAAGGFVAEGAPIRVGKITTKSVVLTPSKLGVIVVFSEELAEMSTPAMEPIVRQAILEDTAEVLDPIMLDATASSAARPAGLLYGVSAAASGYGGGDHTAVVEDFKTLIAPFIAANAADNITVVMNPAQGMALDFMVGPNGTLGDWFSRIRERVSFLESTHATAGRLIALRHSDLATGQGDAPRFDVSNTATVHMEDTTPLEIVSGTGPTTADPVRSFYQTATIGIRMLMRCTWKMRRDGMVQWIDGTSW